MSRERKVDWKNIDGAFQKKRRLHLPQDSDGRYECPVSHCEHSRFQSQRGCRKHVSKTHGWFYYFDEPPTQVIDNSKISDVLQDHENTTHGSISPDVLKTCLFTKAFHQWLTSCAGGGRSKSHADQVLSKILKFVGFCTDDINDAYIEAAQINYSIRSVQCIRAFLEFLGNEQGLASTGMIAYIKALFELIDYIKLS